MKNLIFILILSTPLFCLSQGKSISFASKIKTPYVTFTKDTLTVGQVILVSEGSNQDGSFKYVQLVNNFNEPVSKAESSAAMKKQEIKFFKEQDGTTYLFTKYFVINIEAAIKSKEIIINY
jgi:hypothetical protein